MTPLFGMPEFALLPPIVVTEQVPTRWKQWRFPRSKQRRIRRKWAKSRRNWRSVEVYPNGYMFGGTLVVSPGTFARIQALLYGGGGP